ncbi:uncharacterized protein [Rutidosis leptorrhynchoides]|uniref:uncharacterized protein n=1 Tax=Rutidosis leptorrhynchoides TaxID=125765 RepID=UPI003A98F426
MSDALTVNGVSGSQRGEDVRDRQDCRVDDALDDLDDDDVVEDFNDGVIHFDSLGKLDATGVAPVSRSTRVSTTERFNLDSSPVCEDDPPVPLPSNVEVPGQER